MKAEKEYQTRHWSEEILKALRNNLEVKISNQASLSCKASSMSGKRFTFLNANWNN
jgi:hypothetical protein